MINKSASLDSGAEVRPRAEMIYGEPLLLEGEDRAAYETLWHQVMTTVHPRDLAEEILIRDVVDLTWELLRYRRMRDAFLRSQRVAALEEFLVRCCISPLEARDLAMKWGQKEPDALAEVEEILADRGLDSSAIEAQALASNLEFITRFEGLIAAGESRRNKALREIDHWRRGLGQQLLRATEVDDLPCEDVPTPKGPRRAA